MRMSIILVFATLIYVIDSYRNKMVNGGLF